MALVLAIEKHEQRQLCCNGEPYILHPIRVASEFQDDDLQTIALLHDIIEDTDVTFNDIKNSFGYVIANAVDSLTRKDNESYERYIGRLSCNQLATQVKIADIKDNLRNIARSNNEECKKLSGRKGLYIKALQYLERKIF
jgi:(p)ppGpp synthase/HD superfamily hydrolase